MTTRKSAGRASGPPFNLPRCCCRWRGEEIPTVRDESARSLAVAATSPGQTAAATAASPASTTSPTATSATAAAASATSAASATAAAAAAAACSKLCARPGVFLVEHVERAQIDVRDFLLTERDLVILIR